MSAKVALGIFWDIENCPVPLSKSASSVAKGLRDCIAAAHPECGYAKEFFCVCDTRKVDQRLLEGLDKNGVVVVHVNSTAKNAADDKLQELIDMYVDKYGANGSAVLCIITGDINFAKPIRNARRKDLDVLLIHGRSCSADLKNLVNESYLYEDILRGADNVLKVDNQLKPAYLEVTNLPTDQTFPLLFARLALLSDNCGGKPDTISKGKAFIRFGCKDDAQRCQQRINGAEIYGHKIVVKLFDGDPKAIAKPQAVAKQKSVDQKSAPTAPKLKTRALSQQNLTKSAADLTQTPKQSLDGDDCRSILIGLAFKKSTDLKKLVEDLITRWNDKKATPDLIKTVQGGRINKEKGNTGDTLHVLAVSPEANKLLVFRSKRYLKDSGINWYFKQQKKNEVSNGQNGVKPVAVVEKRANHSMDTDCMSVIKGMDTKTDDNVAKMVRKIVESWGDKAVHPNYIKTVERDRKFAEKDGVVLLFVTANTPENCSALLAAANRHLKPSDGFEWNAYQRKRNLSKDTDTESTVSEGFEIIPRPKAPTVQKVADTPVTDDMLSVISGLETKKADNLAKVVRKLMTEWKDPKINGNMIRGVSRFPGFPDMDGKLSLLVTSVSPQASLALVEAASQHLPPNQGIVWYHYRADTASATPKPLSGLGASAAPLPLNGENSSKGVTSHPLGVKQQPIRVQQSTVVQPVPFVPPQVKTFKGCPLPEAKPLTNIPLIRNKPNFVENHFQQNVNNTGGAPVYQGLSLLSTATQNLMTELGSQSANRSTPVDTRRGEPDKNLFKSLVNGFESLFKSKSPNKESVRVCKPLDADLTTDWALNFATRIHFPPVPFKKSIPEGLTEGYALCISGRLNASADCFAINFFVNNTDIAFHFNVRLPQLLVVRNSFSHGHGWGPEERESPCFPFVVGQRFDLVIQVKTSKYVVLVNRQHFCDYEHRMALSSVKMLSITGVVSIESVGTV